jgi:hypothetical protein
VLPRFSSNLAERPDVEAAADPLHRPRSPPVLSPRPRPPAPSWEPLDPSLPFPGRTPLRPHRNSGDRAAPLARGPDCKGSFLFKGRSAKQGPIRKESKTFRSFFETCILNSVWSIAGSCKISRNSYKTLKIAK